MSFPRYPEYKDSGVEWLGEVPAHWGHASLRRACLRITDGSHFSPQSTDEGKAYVTVRNLEAGRVDLDGAARIGEEDFQKLEEAGCRPATNDILFSKDGTVGKVAVVEDDEFVVLSSLAILRPNPEKLEPKFLFFFLQAANGEKQVESLYVGAALRRITLDAIVGLWIPLPSITEQSAIAAFLDRETAKIDALVAEQEKLIALLKEKRQAVISHAVTKGLDPNVPMKGSGIEWLGGVPAHWEVQRVKSVSTFTTSGPRGWSERVGEDGQLFIQSGDLNDFLQVEFGAAKRVRAEDEAEAIRTRLADGDVVVCITGAKTGNVAVCLSVPEPAYVNQHLCLIRPNQKVLPAFLGVLLKSRIGQTYFELSQYGLKQGLSLEDVREAPVVLPSLEEQQSITAFIGYEAAKLDALTAEAQRAVELLKERRSALISAAVTGKIDVRGASALEAAA